MERDEIVDLLRLLGERLDEQVLALAFEIYGDRLDAAARFFVEELYAEN